LAANLFSVTIEDYNPELTGELNMQHTMAEMLIGVVGVKTSME